MQTHHLALSRRLAVLATMAGVLSLCPWPLAAQKAQSQNQSQKTKDGIPAKVTDASITHVLNRLGFGPRPGDLERVRAMGLTEYIDLQLHPERIDDAALTARLTSFDTLTLSQADMSEKYFAPAQELRRDQQLKQQKAEAQEARSAAMSQDPAMTPERQARPQVPPAMQAAQMMERNVVQQQLQAKMLRAAYSDRQLEEVLTDFWFNHFNVFVGKGQVRTYLTSYERDTIRPHVLGRFRDLLGATAHSPAMLFYLDNFQSATPNPPIEVSPEMQQRLNDPRLRPDQRQALLQRLQMQRDMQQKRPQRGLNENYGRELMELHTLGVDAGYTQKDVTEAARVLTGWTIDRPQMGGAFMFNPRMHDAGEKTVLGVRFPAGGGQEEGERLLDMLAAHPATAHHIAFQLAQRFVADEPPAALVDRATKVFLDTKGDLRQVTRAIITSPEFFSDDVQRGKVKTPLEFVVSAVRATNANVVNAQPLVQAMATLGMPLYGCQPPTGYSMTADAWVNTGALLSRMNFAVQLLDGGRVPPGPRRDGGPAPNAANRPGVAGDPNAPDRPAGPPPELFIGPNRPGQGQGVQGQAARGQGAGDRGLMRPGQMARMPIQVDLPTLAPDTTEATRDRLVADFLGGRASAGTSQTLARAASPQQLVALTLGSPEFQRR